jgi:hypothetical protein
MAAALGNGNTSSAYLCCATLYPNGRPKVYVLHTLSRYPPTALDGTVTPWDNQLFGCLGDQVQDTIVTVMIPPTAFAVTPDARVYTMGAIEGQVAQLPEQDLFQRITQANNEVEQLRTRALMYLPSRSAPLLLNNNRGWSPKAAYASLFQAFALEQQGNVGNADDVQPILDWLRLTLHATGNDNAGPPVTSVALTIPMMDEDLTAHRSPIVQRFIRPRQGLTTGLELAINNMATSVTNQATEVNRALLARTIERETPATPSTKFGLLLPSLKNFLHVQEEEELPEFWFQFASASKKQEFSVLRDYLELYARSEHAFVSTPPILSPKLHSDLATITFVADHDNDLKTGLQPFIAMDGSEDYRAAALELARSYSILYERDHGVSLQDLNQLKIPKELRSYPVSFFDLERNLGVFGNLLGTILGNAHPLTTAYRPFWESFSKRYKDRLLAVIDGSRSIKPVHILRSVQLKCYDWFDAKRSRVPPDTPDFGSIWKRISLNEYTLPMLPPQLYFLVTPKLSLLKPGPNPAGLTIGTTGTGTTAGLTGSDDASTVVSAVSALTGTTGLTGTGTRTLKGANTMITNENPDAYLLTLVPFNRKLKDLMGDTVPPNTDAGKPICLSYHVKGGCYSNCRRRNNHGRVLTLAEKQRLENYIADRLAKT